MKKFLLIIAVSILLLSDAAHAELVNGGFETGDFTGWTVVLPPALPPTDTEQSHLNQPEGQANVINSFSTWAGLPTPQTYFPVGGLYFAQIVSPLYNTTTPTQVITRLSQEIYLSKGDYVSGSAAFYNYNGFYGGDEAWVKIYKNGTEITCPWYAYSGYPGYAFGYGYLQPIVEGSPWISWGWTVPEAGVYTLELSQQDLAPGGVGTFPSVVLFDNISVPEPTAIILLGLGLVGVVGVRRKLKSQI